MSASTASSPAASSRRGENGRSSCWRRPSTTRVSPEEADLAAGLNDVRLVLGTELDVTEDFDWDGLDPDDERLPALAVYAYVS